MLDQSDRRTPVVLLAGVSGPAMTGVEHIAATLSEDAGTVVVHHDLAELREGVV
ncbi:cobalamin biosynthesis protein CobW, partial [Nocardia cyriacigeorgica]|nr:cobalamin biosynthesis protein CobW [Nocardia cyriacigeorgica]